MVGQISVWSAGGFPVTRFMLFEQAVAYQKPDAAAAQIAEAQALADEWRDKNAFQRALEELDSRDAEWWEEHNN